MITMLSGSSLNKLFYGLLELSRGWGQEERRDNKSTLDSTGPVVIELTNPRNRVLTVPRRNANFPATCAETLWVLVGRDNLEFLKFYLPRAGDFSDDNGLSWRAAYGPRLRGKGEVPGLTRVDQLRQIVYELKDHPNTRRAVMTLLEPINDMQDFTVKDFPCTGYLSFMPRNGKLDLLVTIRSNDLLWGFSAVNVWEWTVLHELVSLMTGIPLGVYYQVSNSLHYYAEFESRFEDMRVAEPFDVYDYLQAYQDKNCCELKVIDRMLFDFFEVEAEARAGGWGYLPGADYCLAGPGPELIKNMVRVVLVALLLKTKQSDLRDGSPAYGLLNAISDNPMRIALLEWVRRTWKMDPLVLGEMDPLMDKDPLGAYVAGLL